MLKKAIYTPLKRFLDGRGDVAAAFAMRRLSSLYRGPLVRIRRSSDNAEADFGAGQSGVDWGTIAAFAGAGSPFASKWYDQSGLGRDLAQSTAANQPLVSLLANGLPGLVFDGVNDSLVTATFALNQPNSFNIVYRQVSQTQTGFQNVFDGVTADTNTLFSTTAGTENRMYAGNTGPISDAGTSMPVGTRGAVGGTFNGAASVLTINAATIASFTGDTSTNNADGITLGGRGGGTSTRFDNIEVHELIRFNSAHSLAALQADSAAMRAAWRF